MFTFQDPFAKGEIFIGDATEGFSVACGVTPGMKEFEQGHSFTLQSPGSLFGHLWPFVELVYIIDNCLFRLALFITHTPRKGRNWCLGAETNDERQQWMQALESVINKRSSVTNDAIKESTRTDLRDSYIKRSKFQASSLWSWLFDVYYSMIVHQCIHPLLTN